jgi:hypothetical protein
MMLAVLESLTGQGGPFLASTSKDGVQAFVKEDSDGSRVLQVYVPAGGNIGRDPERIRSEDLTAVAFNEAGKELGLATPSSSSDTGVLVAVCNAGACNAIKTFYFSVPHAETEGVRKVVVTFRNRQYDLAMEKYPPRK